MTSTPSIPELLARLNEVDESHEIEAKRSESEVGKSALETVSAFANEPGLGGGYILFGVTENEAGQFDATGVTDPKKIEQDFASVCATGFNRTVRPRVWTETVSGVSLVAAFVPEASPAEKPVFLKAKGIQGGAYRRIGSTDQRCTDDDLRVIFQASSATPYEDTVVDDAMMDDLDPEVIGTYRRSLVEENPATELRDASLEQLVQSLGGAKRLDGSMKPTVAGVLLFGRPLSLRRLFPGVRVDYIRVPGTEWVPDPDHRFESIEVRQPLLIAFRRIYNAVVDDLPKAFALEPGSPERKDRMALPESAVREVLINALTHCDYRVPSPTQVIRFQDRLEVRNAGYSLAGSDQFGEPGSFPRNMRIADVFREMRLAENKGTGITAVRRAMDRAGLTPPVFDSDRSRNRFVATLWLHNLISTEESAWLEQVVRTKVSDAQARALVVARRTGFVTNAILRDVSGLDTLAASDQLRKLRDLGLLEVRGKGSATEYIISSGIRAQAGAGVGSPPGGGQRGGFGEQKGGFPEQKGGFRPGEAGVSDPKGGLDGAGEALGLLQEVPPRLRAAIEALGGRPAPAALRKVLVELCELRWWTPRELAVVLGRRDAPRLSENHLSPLVKEGALERRYPENPAHPQQAYRSRQRSLLGSDDVEG